MARSIRANRIQELRAIKGLSRRELAELAGTVPGQIAKLERGERRLTPEWLNRLAPHLDAIPHELLPNWNLVSKAVQDASAAFRNLQQTQELLSFEGGNYFAVQVYDGRILSGRGALDDPAGPLGFDLFRTDWFKQIASVSPRDLIVFALAGDSMAETLRDGDQVLIDRTRKSLGTDGIYALRLAGGIEIRRVSNHPTNKTVTLKCDNPLYPSFEGLPHDDLEVVGRVIWISRAIVGAPRQPF